MKFGIHLISTRKFINNFLSRCCETAGDNRLVRAGELRLRDRPVDRSFAIRTIEPFKALFGLDDSRVASCIRSNNGAAYHIAFLNIIRNALLLIAVVCKLIRSRVAGILRTLGHTTHIECEAHIDMPINAQNRGILGTTGNHIAVAAVIGEAAILGNFERDGANATRMVNTRHFAIRASRPV